MESNVLESGHLVENASDPYGKETENRFAIKAVPRAD